MQIFSVYQEDSQWIVILFQLETSSEGKKDEPNVPDKSLS